MKALLAIDGSATARAAVRAAATFPFPADTEVILLTVEGDLLRADEAAALSSEARAMLDASTKGSRDALDELLQAEADVLRDAGLDVRPEIREGHAAAQIVAAAAAHDVDLIIVGSHGRTGYKRFFLGSVSTQVMQSADRSVLVVRDPRDPDGDHPAPPSSATKRPRRLLLGFDGSAPSLRAVELCAGLALDDRDAVHLLTVLPTIHLYRQDIRQVMGVVWQQRRAAETAALQAAAARFDHTASEISTAIVEASDVGQAILDAAETFDADLIVLGHKGGGAIERFLLGSVTPKVAHHSPISVLVVR